MQAVVTPLDGSESHVLDATDAKLTWGIFGGPLLCDLPHDFYTPDLRHLRMARVQVYGDWGLCWEGYVTRVHPDRLEASGPNVGLAEPLTRAQFCHTSTSEWLRRTSNATTIAKYLEMNTSGSGFTITVKQGDYLRDYSYDGMFLRLPKAFTKVRITGSYYRVNTAVEYMACYTGTYGPDEDGQEGTWSSPTNICPLGSGSQSGTFDITMNASGDMVMMQYIFDSTGDSAVFTQNSLRCKLYNIKVYAETDTAGNVITPTLAAIAERCVRWAPDWLQNKTTGAYDAIGTAIEPFYSPDGVVPADILREALTYESARFLWRCGPDGCKPRLDALPTTPTYIIDLRSDDVEWTPGGWDADLWADTVEVEYLSADGSTKRSTTRQATSGYLTNVGVHRTVGLKVDTTSTTQAQRVGDIALAELNADRYAGTVTTPRVTTANGATVPLMHLVPGERVLLVGYDGTLAPRLIECALEGGRCSLTLDTASGALDRALARLAVRQT